MRIEEARRRNRRRAFLLATVAAANYWLVSTIILGIVILQPGKNRTVQVEAWLAFGLAALFAAAGLAFVVRRRVRGLGPRLVRRLGATPIDASDARLVGLLDELSIAVGLPPVAAALVTDPAPNALTVGTRRDDATIIVTTGLLDRLTRDELEAVLAVQLSAIDRLDVMLRTVVSACTEPAIEVNPRRRSRDPRKNLAEVVSAPSRIIAEEVRERARTANNHAADDMAIAITRHPDALVRALVKLRADPQLVAHRNLEFADLWFEPLPAPEHGEYGIELAGYALDDRIARLTRLVPPA